MNDKKKKKILLIGIIIGVMLAAIIISAIILFRDDTKEGVHEGGTFTEKMTEGTTERKADVKTTSKATTTETPTERPTTAATTERATTERPTAEKPKPEQATTEHVHTWKDVYETQEKKVCVSEAWDEDVYEDHSFCSYCGKDISGNPNHIFNCGEKYYSESLGEEIYEGSSAVIKPTKVDTIHHPAEYEIQKEKVLVGRKCSTCGAWQ